MLPVLRKRLRVAGTNALRWLKWLVLVAIATIVGASVLFWLLGLFSPVLHLSHFYFSEFRFSDFSLSNFKVLPKVEFETATIEGLLLVTGAVMALCALALSYSRAAKDSASIYAGLDAGRLLLATTMIFSTNLLRHYLEALIPIEPGYPAMLGALARIADVSLVGLLAFGPILALMAIGRLYVHFWRQLITAHGLDTVVSTIKRGPIKPKVPQEKSK